MLRVIVLLAMMSSSVLAQGISIGIHGAGAWNKPELVMGGEKSKAKDYEFFKGVGADLSFKPALFPIGFEAGYTYLTKTLTEEGIKTKLNISPLYASGKFYLGPMFYVAAGINYSFWDFEIDGESAKGVDGKLGYQAGAGLEMGAGTLRLCASGYYMIQKCKVGELEGEDVELQCESLQLRVGLRVSL